MRQMRDSGRLVGSVIGALMILVSLAPLADIAVAGPLDQQVTGNHLELTAMSIGEPDSEEAPDGTIRIVTRVNYQLQTVKNGLLALFIFRDNESGAARSSEVVPIPGGAGRVTLTIDYEPDTNTHELALLIGMFTEDKKIIGWVETNALSVSALGSRYRFNEALAARSNGDNSLALSRLSGAIAISPDAGQLYYWRADTNLRLGNFEDAIADYSSAMQLLPGDLPSLVGRGIARAWNAQYGEAVQDLSAAIDTGSGPTQWIAWAHRTRGVAYAALGMSANAVADYRSYLDILPEAADRAMVDDWIAQLEGW